MRKVGVLRSAILTLGLALVTAVVLAAADLARDVEHVLREIRQDAPLPTLSYLQPAESINADSAYFQGRYGDIAISVETLPGSDRVASILLKIRGPDRTREILPAVSRLIGPPHSSAPDQSIYGWEWPKYRAASVHYAGGGTGRDGATIVSIFYR